jgi:hypothetical protein
MAAMKKTRAVMALRMIGVVLAGLLVLALNGIDFLGGKARRKDDLQHLYVVAVAELSVSDAGRLMHTGPSLQTNNAVAFVLELDPSLQDVDELKARLVEVRLAGERLAGRCPNDVGVDSPLGCSLDAQVTILVERSKASFKDCILGV